MHCVPALEKIIKPSFVLHGYFLLVSITSGIQNSNKSEIRAVLADSIAHGENNPDW